MGTLIQDLRYGFRNLLKRPAFALIAILTLAIGIGANTAVFSLVHSLLFRPRPVHEPERLLEVYVGDKQIPYQNHSYPDFLVFREQVEVLSGLAAYHIAQFKFGGAENIEQVWGEAVSGNYFDLLGVTPSRGRTFLPEEDQTPGTRPVAVISHAFWQRHFAADPTIIGRSITLNNQSLTVVGVLGPEYNGMIRGLGIDVWVPTMMMPQMKPEIGLDLLNSRGNRWVFLVGRLKPEASLQQARARFELIAQQLKESFPEAWREKQSGPGAVRERFISVLPESETRIHPGLYSSAYAAVALVLVIINLVLLVACMNLAGLLLARAFERRHEIAVRLALGAKRVRIIRQLLTESVLLALIAGLAGTLLAVWLINLLVAHLPTLPEGIRLSIDLSMDWRVLAWSLGFSFFVGVLFGLVPALQASRRNVVEALNRSSASLAAAYARSRLRNALIVAQVAFALLLLVSAGLVTRSVRNIAPTKLGFDTTNLVVAPLGLDRQYDRARSQEFYRLVHEQTRSLPGVVAVSFVDSVPGGLLGRTRKSVGIEGYQPSADEKMEIDSSTVSAGYFTDLNIPIVDGREFTESDRDGAPCVAVVNEAFHRRYFANTSALGKRLTKFRSPTVKENCEIVGVVRDDKMQSLLEKPVPWFAFPLQQTHSSRMMMLVRSVGPPGDIVPLVRRAIHSVDQKIPVNDVLTLNDTFKPFLYLYQVFGMLIGSCGLVAVLLACLGIYGTVAYSVTQRTREIGIRMALGADQRNVLGLVIRQGMVWVLTGLSLGLLLAIALTRVLTSSMFEVELLYGVKPTDFATYLVVCALVMMTTLLACYLPARRAARVDPLEALRSE